MANEVKIKLSADGKQVRQEIKLIERELQELGGNPIRGKSGSQQGKTSSSRSDSSSGNKEATNSSDKVKQETRDKVNSQSLREMTLIRKELQKINGTSGYGGNPGNGGGGGGFFPPSTGTGSGSGSGNGSGSGSGKLLDAVGKLATAATALKAVTAAYHSLKNSAQSAQTGASLAFTTYGSTLAYTDYNAARKDASVLGKVYGYDSTTTMNAGEANMSSGAGFTTLDNYNSDLNAILRTSKFLGIDTGVMAQTSGYMSSIGVTESGDQQRFANILAQSIVDAEMTGREDEQLRVLENIADNLASVNTTVSEQSMTNSLQLYNALVNQNENLKGERGSEVVSSLNDLATSGNSTFMNLLGYGTEYTGVQGLQELRRQIEQDPTAAIQKAYSNWMSSTGSYMDEDQAKAMFSEFLHSNTSLSQTEIDDALSAIGDTNFSESLNKDYDTSEGESLLNDVEENYNNDKISTEERHDVEKQENSDDRGNLWNNITKPFESLYNMMPDWMQQGADIIGGATPYVAGGFGLKALGQGFSNWKATGNPFTSGTGGGAWKNFWGKGASSAADDVVSGAANAADDVVIDLVEGADGVWRQSGETAANTGDDVLGLTDDIISNTGDDLANAAASSVDDIANAASSSIDDIANGVANSIDDAVAGAADDILSNSADDIISNSADDVLSSTLGNGAKSIFGKALGPLIQLGFGAYNYATADDDWERSGAVGQTGGGIIGGLLGSIAGPLGSIAGGWAGGELGDAIGESAETGKQNWGSIFAGDWNPLYGLWRKDGTITQQKLNGTYDWSNEEVTVQNADGTETTSTVGEIEKQNAEVRAQWSADNADDVEAFKQQLLASVQDDGSVDLSFLQGTDMATVGMLMDSAFGHNKLTGLQYMMASGQTMSDIDFGAGEEENYEKQIEALMESMDSNSSAVDNLTTILQNAESESNAEEEESSSKSVWYKPWTWFSHATGNDYVPYDNYTALLHKGEMVLTSSEADDYRQGKAGNGSAGSHATGIDININLNGAIDGMTVDNQNLIVQAVVSQIASSGLQDMISNGFVRTQNY